MKNIIILTIFFYFLFLLETSFFPHFFLFSYFPFLTLIFVILINFFEPKKEKFGFFSAFFAGFFLDIFSNRPIGFNILIFLLTAFFVKLILKNFLRIPSTFKGLLAKN